MTVFAALRAECAMLNIGDPAPTLQVGKWVQGEPVRQFDADHVYIVEFWATWCGPCLVSIPHLNELAEKFKDKGVIVIGQNVWDKDEAVEPFVKKMGGKMTYRVAMDDKTQDTNGFMASHWWKRKVEGHTIPTAVIINKAGRIAWIGYPSQLTEKVIEDVLADKIDPRKTAAARVQEPQRWGRVLSDSDPRSWPGLAAD